ncbi:lipoyl(octanoyl) transferase [Streptoalloteichus tenebrarius]|uniref:Octanoyltransferase n=1 Tax=Streptoalloteichus tenebrarius (strain ATCC 17920 / DSM 40477 / JCM 4838 / CBS 697.72 / NBRC 16177 / NCIMB 11028 / NRRL B-12390 / A12253. 1 / ISP 5477) TaxID=1933 RepID=A0ABT1I3K4_STRSD|nr:lipoyl(octanoyl) transferase [Streptoalloteichus tenebrarius]
MSASVSRPDTSCRLSTDPVEVRRLGTIDYVAAWDLQRELNQARAEGRGPDTLLLLEHHSVYTAGKRTRPEDRPDDGTPVVDVDRGGKITWHGPGQLVGYPIVGLAEPVDVVDYVRRLEQGLIAVCDELGVVGAGRVEGRSGVWLPADDRRPERKVAAIGVRVQRGVTMHGFAINCDPDMAAWSRIVPCGIRDAGVASLSDELGRDVSVAEVLPVAERAVLAALEGELPVSDRDLRRERPAAPGVTFALSH